MQLREILNTSVHSDLILYLDLHICVMKKAFLRGDKSVVSPHAVTVRPDIPCNSLELSWADCVNHRHRQIHEQGLFCVAKIRPLSLSFCTSEVDQMPIRSDVDQILLSKFTSTTSDSRISDQLLMSKRAGSLCRCRRHHVFQEKFEILLHIVIFLTELF